VQRETPESPTEPGRQFERPAEERKMKCEPVSEILALVKEKLDQLSADELRKLAEWIEVYAQSKERATDCK
jgi:hypothetical protein